MGLDMMCNTIQKKSVAMICRSKEHKDLNFPDLYLSEQVLNACTTAKYLGHIIINEMSDDDDMYRQCRKLYAQANMLMRKCNMCSDQVKINLLEHIVLLFVLLPCGLSLRKRAYVSFRLVYHQNKMVQCKWFIL